MNKNLFSIICIIVIIILLYVNFNNTENFYFYEESSYNSIISNSGVYINIKQLPNQPITWSGTGSETDGEAAITGFHIEIPVDNNDNVLGISESGRLGILPSGTNNAKWGVLEITRDNINTLIKELNSTNSKMDNKTVVDTLPPNEKLDDVESFHMIYEPDSNWNNRKIASESNGTTINRFVLHLNQGNLDVGNYVDNNNNQKWDMSYDSVNPIKINQDKMTHVGPLPYLESDPNSIAIKLNIDDDKLKNLFGGNGSDDVLPAKKCDTWLSKDAVSSLCPGCVPP
jgi:hypothetical protein